MFQTLALVLSMEAFFVASEENKEFRSAWVDLQCAQMRLAPRRVRSFADGKEIRSKQTFDLPDGSSETVTTFVDGSTKIVRRSQGGKREVERKGAPSC